MEIQWPLVFYFLLTCLGAGAFAFVGVTEWLGKAERTRMPASITALVAMAAGGIASAFHLGHVERIVNVLGNLNSGISQDMILTALAGLAILVYIAMMWRGSSVGARKTVAVVGLVLTLVLVIRMGSSYVLPARPAWNTFLLPLLYVASAAVLGLFTVYVWAARKEEKATVTGVNKATLIALAIQALVVIGYVIFLAAAPYQDPSRSAIRLLAGDLALAFWLGVVVIGLAVPLALTMRVQTAKEKAGKVLSIAALGLGCVLVGGVVLRGIIYILGTSIEQFL